MKKEETPKPPPDEFRIYDDKAIHGWLEKRSKGYFASAWKRVFVTIDHQKICYFTDAEMTNMKGVIDFTKIKARLFVIGENEITLTVPI